MRNSSKFKKNEGLTLLEILLTVSIVGIISVGTMPAGIGLLHRNHLRNTRDVLISYLNTARIFSIGAKNSNVWGVHVSEEGINLFCGPSYASRDPNLDSNYEIPKSVNAVPKEIVFSKYIGETEESSILLEGATGEIFMVSINTEGNITVE